MVMCKDCHIMQYITTVMYPTSDRSTFDCMRPALIHTCRYSCPTKPRPLTPKFSERSLQNHQVVNVATPSILTTPTDCSTRSTYAGLAAAVAARVLLPPPADSTIASAVRFLPAFVRGHSSNGLFVLRFGTLCSLSSVPAGVGSGSSW